MKLVSGRYRLFSTEYLEFDRDSRRGLVPDGGVGVCWAVNALADSIIGTTLHKLHESSYSRLACILIFHIIE